MRIGIGISTHNRYGIFKTTYKNIKKFAPLGAKIVVVDDASDVPVKEATFRFDKNQGIAKTKNKLLELLDDCKHVFLFDDDTHPVIDNWWKPYVESPEPHLMYIFEHFKSRQLGDTKVIFEDIEHKAYTHPRGCMLYIDSSILPVVGGFDEEYARWGFEHVDYSNRIYNNRLTSFRFQDVQGSEHFFYSADEHEAVSSTVTGVERSRYLESMRPKFKASYKSDKFCAYKKVDPYSLAEGEDVVLTSYFTKQVDLQRNIKWETNWKDLEALAKSVRKHGYKLVVLNDCFNKKDSKDIEFVDVKTSMNPYKQRWLEYYKYLRAHPEVKRVFCVDATDVQMLKDPFKEMEHGKIYVGEEQDIVANSWMVKNASRGIVRNFIVQNRRQKLLNCGVIGGSRSDILKFTHDVWKTWTDPEEKNDPFDMTIFNYVAYTFYRKQIEHGHHVTTYFKQYETDAPSWWSHK